MSGNFRRRDHPDFRPWRVRVWEDVIRPPLWDIADRVEAWVRRRRARH